MNWQIQAWPSPEIFIRRFGREFLERENTAYSLLSVVKPTADPRNVGADRAAANYSLLSCWKNPPITETETETAGAAYSLISVTLFAVVSQSQSDAGAADYSLASVLVLTPDVRDLSSSPEESAADYSLLSCNVI